MPEGLAYFIKTALIKDPQARISNWKTIHDLLNPEEATAAENLCELSATEYGIFIKIKNDSTIDKSDILASIEHTLQKKAVDFTVKTVAPEDAKSVLCRSQAGVGLCAVAIGGLS